MVNTGILVSEAITDIITEFESYSAGDKQYFDIRKTDAWKTLRGAKLTDTPEVRRLEDIIDALVDYNMRLCDEFGDKF